jgi:hypothetical protein
MLDDPSENNSREHFYLTLDGNRFHRNTVLNHRRGSRGVLRRGDELEGLLLAQAFETLPSKHKPGDRLPLVLSVADQFGGETEWPIDLIVQPPQAKRHTCHVSVFETDPPMPDLEDSAIPAPLPQTDEGVMGGSTTNTDREYA